MSERDWSDSDYVRIYQSIRRDPKFDTIRDDDRALAAYVRLLMDADPVWPLPASLPASLSRYARDRLVRAGILIITGKQYTLSGLDKERRARDRRYGPDGSGRRRYPSDSTPTSTPASESVSTPASDLARAGASASVSDSVSDTYDEKSSGRSGAGRGRGALRAAIDYIETRTGRAWSFGEGSKPWATLQADVHDFGWEAVKDAMAAEAAPHPDVGQLVFGATRRLHPISSPPTSSRAEQKEAEARAILAAAADRKPVRA